MDKLLRKTLVGYVVTYMLIFVLTILMLIPIYNMAYTSARNVMERNLTSVLTNNVDRLANEFYKLELFIKSLSKRSEIVNMAYRPDKSNSHMIDGLKLNEQLRDPFIADSVLVKDLIILFRNSEYVVSKGIVQNRKLYWGNTLSIDGMTQEQFETALLEEKVNFFGMTNVGTKYMLGKQPSICLNYFSNTRLSTYYAICAVITEQAIYDILHEDTVDENGWMRVTDIDGNELFSYSAEGLGECSEWSFTSDILPITLHVGVDERVFAASVSNVQRTIIAYCMAAFLAVIVLSMIMAMRIYSPIKEYVNFIKQQDWMDSETGMQNLQQCIYESMRKFTIDRETLKRNLDQLRGHYQNMMLLSLSEGTNAIQKEQLEKFFDGDTVLNGKYVAVRLYTGEHGGTVGLDNMERAYRYASERIKDHFYAHCVTAPRHLMIISVNDMRMDGIDDYLEETCERIAQMKQNHEPVVMRLARSSVHYGVGELKQACDEVGSMIQNIQPFVQEGRYLLCYECHADVSSAAALSTFYPNALYSVLMSGNVQAISDQMDSLKNQFVKLFLERYNRVPAFYYNIVSVFELVMARLKVEVGIDEYDASWTVDAMCERLERIAQDLGEAAAMRSRKPDGTDAIIEFLDEHYCESGLCLSMLSVRFKLSEAYISRMIKLKTGQTYTEYVELLRMRKAETLLRDTQDSVSDIALKLGYETPNTFFKAFKRVYHVSPGAYRDGIKHGNGHEMDD